MCDINRKQKAGELFNQGYNCSQAVFAAYADLCGMDEASALKLSSSFGGGMGRMREVCGACSAAFMVVGALYGYNDPTDKDAKKRLYTLIQKMAGVFKEKNGSVICRELLSSQKPDSSPAPMERTPEFYKTRPCIKYVSDACDIINSVLSEQKEHLMSL